MMLFEEGPNAYIEEEKALYKAELMAYLFLKLVILLKEIFFKFL